VARALYGRCGRSKKQELEQALPEIGEVGTQIKKE